MCAVLSGSARPKPRRFHKEPPLIEPDQAEYVIKRGERAAALLANPSFTWIVDDLTTQQLQQIIAAPPGELGRNAREGAAYIQHALTEIVSLLQGYAATGEAQQLVLNALSDGDDTFEDTP